MTAFVAPADWPLSPSRPRRQRGAAQHPAEEQSASEVLLQQMALRDDVRRTAMARERAVAWRDQFSLIEVMLPQGKTSDTLARSVAGFRALRARRIPSVPTAGR